LVVYFLVSAASGERSAGKFSEQNIWFKFNHGMEPSAGGGAEVIGGVGNTLLLVASLVIDASDSQPRRRALKIEPNAMGHEPGLNSDDIEPLLEYGESERHR